MKDLSNLTKGELHRYKHTVYLNPFTPFRQKWKEVDRINDALDTLDRKR